MFHEDIMNKRREIARLYSELVNADQSKIETYILFNRVKDEFYTQTSNPTIDELKYTYDIKDNEEKLNIDDSLLYRLCNSANIKIFNDGNKYYFNMKLPIIPMGDISKIKAKKYR